MAGKMKAGKDCRVSVVGTCTRWSTGGQGRISEGACPSPTWARGPVAGTAQIPPGALSASVNLCVWASGFLVREL